MRRTYPSVVRQSFHQFCLSSFRSGTEFTCRGPWHHFRRRAQFQRQTSTHQPVLLEHKLLLQVVFAIMADIVQAFDPESQSSQTSLSRTEQLNTTSPNPETTFRSIYDYQWDQDSDFQSGLSSIRGHTDQASSEALVDHDFDLLLQAQCFYFAR